MSFVPYHAHGSSDHSFLRRTQWQVPRIWICWRSDFSHSYRKNPMTPFCSKTGPCLTSTARSGGSLKNICHGVGLGVLPRTLVCLWKSGLPDPRTTYHAIFSCGVRSRTSCSYHFFLAALRIWRKVSWLSCQPSTVISYKGSGTVDAWRVTRRMHIEHL